MPVADLETIMPLLIGVWRRFHKLSGPGDVLQTREFRSVVQAVQQLQKGLETGHELIGQNYFENPDLLGAYLLYYWVLHYQQGLALINEVPTVGRVLDLASGPGAFAFAALRHGAREVVALDRNATALKLASEICGRYGLPLAIRQHSLQKFPYPVEGKFDLIILGYCLEELFPDTEKGWQQAQLNWIRSLMFYLSPQGKFLFVESSLTHANHRLLALRDQLVKEGFPVQAPCVWKGECVALKANNVCYAQREFFEKPFLIKEIQRAAQINLGSLKMSYLIMRNPEAGWPWLPNHPLYRVISPPVETHAGKRFHLCGTDGKKDIGTHLKEGSPEARAFDYLKRGELISIDNALVKGDHFDIVLGTRVKIEAALNKPLPQQDQ